MPEHSQRVATYWLVYFCDECGKEVELTSIIDTIPRRYKHTCVGCGAEIVLEREYPAVVYTAEE